MGFKRKVPKDTPIIITLKLENSGLLYVKAEEQLYHTILKAELDVKNSLSEADKKMAIERTKKANIE